MAVSSKVSAASARAHTRRKIQFNSSSPSQGNPTRFLLIIFFGLLAWGYKAIQPAPPTICGSPGGPPVTASRIKLRDGRHLAYKEFGVQKDMAKYKIIFIHGFQSSRQDFFPVSLAILEELGIYLVSFDRAGYGESDPNPKRTEKSIALDIEQLADQLEFGSKFYIIGFSMGGQIAWTCLKYIPERYGLRCTEFGRISIVHR